MCIFEIYTIIVYFWYTSINIHHCILLFCTVMERVKECVTDAVKELGYPEMKLEQLEVAAIFIEGRDVVAVLPTGFGKGLCYACLPLAFDKKSESILSSLS